MVAEGERAGGSGMRALIGEASLALARLDAGRLEELAVACEALNRDLPGRTGKAREEVLRELLASAGEMAILARVLDATRRNLRVMQRLRDLRAGRVEYTEGLARGGAEAGNGHN